MPEWIRWIAGFLTGAAWSAVNLILIINILKVALLRQEKAKLFVMLLVKFPVLYLAGLLILVSGAFSALSLLSGATLSLAGMGVARVCLRPR